VIKTLLSPPRRQGEVKEKI